MKQVLKEGEEEYEIDNYSAFHICDARSLFTFCIYLYLEILVSRNPLNIVAQYDLYN